MTRSGLCLLAALAAVSAMADQDIVEELIVRGETDKRTIQLSETTGIVPDSAALLRQTVGANVVRNGPITGIAQYRGMSRFRIHSHIDGAVISPGGPNWMDPPLSYAPAAHLDSLEIYRGIAPVSAGQETIGGVVNATTWSGTFADTGTAFSGRLRAGTQSMNNANLLSAALVLSSPGQRLKVSGLTEGGNDAEFPGGDIVPSEYQRERYDIGYSIRHDSHTISLDYGHNRTGDAGTPALAMDIRNIDADLYRFGYAFAGEAFDLTTRIYASDIDHGMSNYHLRTPPADPGRHRFNRTDAQNLGFTIEVASGDWTFGVDGHDVSHNSDIDNPNNPMFFVRNFNDAKRRVLGAYVERWFSLPGNLSLEAGVRFNRVRSDADSVDATPAQMGMPAAVALRDAFNGADRSRRDNNVDWVLKSYLPAGPGTVLYAGAARKTRAPSYQELYLWLPLQATAGLADGRSYTGNLNLDPEVAHEVELGVDWTGQRLTLTPRLFYRQVDDYIQGTPSTNAAARMFVAMMDGADAPAPLEFNNVDAVLYGFDMDWRYRLSNHWSLAGVINVVRGERDDIDDNLYRIAPANGFIALTYARADWEVTLETAANAAQNKVSTTNGEPPSSGYALVNISGQWAMNDRAKVGFGVDNLFDRQYTDHLAGINRVSGNPDIAPGKRLPGYGRNLFARLDFVW